MRMKLARKTTSLCLTASLALVAAHRSSRQITYKKLDGWTCEVVSGMFSLRGWREMDWREKVAVQSCGRALVKPKNQPGGAGSLMAEMKHIQQCGRLGCSEKQQHWI